MTRFPLAAVLCFAALRPASAAEHAAPSADRRSGDGARGRLPTSSGSGTPSHKRSVGERPRAAHRARAKLSPVQTALYNTLHAYIRGQVKKNFGFYPVEDKEYNESWMTKLEEIEVRAARRVFEDEYIVRAAFRELPMDTLARTDGQETAGEPVPAPESRGFKVDFTLVRAKTGGWKIKEKALYSIGEVKLFRYTDSHERVPIERERHTSAFSFDGPDRVPPADEESVEEGESDGRPEDGLLPNDPRPDGPPPPSGGGVSVPHEAPAAPGAFQREKPEGAAAPDDPFAADSEEDGEKGGEEGFGINVNPCPDCEKGTDGG